MLQLARARPDRESFAVVLPCSAKAGGNSCCNSRDATVHFGRKSPQTEEQRTKLAVEKAVALVEEGEPSHATRALQAAELAPGTLATLDELRDVRLRPPEPV